MASWANPDEGLCPQCGHTNCRQWILCDGCGARLPWAPDDDPKKGLNDLSDEQLALLFKPGAYRKDGLLSMFADRRNRTIASVVIVFLVSSLVEWIVRALHLF